MALTSVAPYVFNPNELLTLGIAAYAAVVSTFVLGWNAYKWLASGGKIDLAAIAHFEGNAKHSLRHDLSKYPSPPSDAVSDMGVSLLEAERTKRRRP